MRHSREVYAKFVMDGEEYKNQILKNIIYIVDLAECSVRQLVLPDMPPEEKMFYYQKAAELYEVVLDGKYAGFYDPALLSNYVKIAEIYVQLGEVKAAEKYVDRIISSLEKHITESEKKNKSKLLYATAIPNSVSTQQLCEKLLQNMLQSSYLHAFKDKISNMNERYISYFKSEG